MRMVSSPHVQTNAILALALAAAIVCALASSWEDPGTLRPRKPCGIVWSARHVPFLPTLSNSFIDMRNSRTLPKRSPKPVA